MFLNSICKRNPALVEACVTLHQRGELPANTYVVDLDTLAENARMLAAEGAKHGLRVFPMTKQLGRNPAVLRTLQAAGLDACVCVDMQDARPVHANGLQIGHLGHLVQVPRAETRAGVAMRPLFWTVYSLEKAKEISAALAPGQTQKVLARVYAEGDTFYKGHEGGFPAGEIVSVARQLAALPGIEFAGLSTFPAQLYDAQAVCIRHTHNYETLLAAADALHAAGFGKLELNAPGTTSSLLFAELAQHGITQVEPGHGLTGTTPLHAMQELAELPAMAYVSEVSHFHVGKAYCFGGGMYIDPVFPEYEVRACVGATPEQALAQRIACDMPAPSSIDYYGILAPQAGQLVAEGDTVVFGFRAQAFVTRAYTAGVSGIRSGTPRVEGVYGPDGREAGWPQW